MFVSERGPCAPVREGERLAKTKNEQVMKMNEPEKKSEKGQWH